MIRDPGALLRKENPMPQTFIPCGDHLEDLSTITASSAAIFEAKGMSEDAARDLSAKAQGYASWDEMLSQSWSLSDEGMLAGRIDGRRIEIDLSEVIALPVMTRDEAWATDIRVTSLKILPPGEEAHERMLLWHHKNHEDFEDLEYLGIRDDLSAALQKSSDRLAALAETGIAMASEEGTHISHSVENLPMLRADALEFARRFFKDAEVSPQVYLEDRDDFPVPKIDDFVLYGLVFQKFETENGTEIAAYTLSSHDTKQISGGDGSEITDALFTLEISETGHFEDEALGSVILVREGEIEDAYDDISEVADPGYEF